MRSVLADLRFAARSFGRQPGATALIFVTLTLGVAANTAVFAIVDGLFLRPFPFPQPDRLAYVNERAPSWNLEFTGIDYSDFHTWRERARAFEAIALWSPTSINLADDAGAERVDGLAVTYDFPTVLGIKPLLGRSFTKEEDGPAPSRVANAAASTANLAPIFPAIRVSCRCTPGRLVMPLTRWPSSPPWPR